MPETNLTTRFVEAVKPITERVTQFVRKHQRKICAFFLGAWALLLVALAASWFFGIAMQPTVKEGLTEGEYRVLNGAFGLIALLTLVAMVGGVLLYRRRKSLVPLTIFLGLVSLVALVPLWLKAFGWG